MLKTSTVAALLLLILVPLISVAQIPRTLSYQGVLTDSLGNPKPDGTYTFTFRLYAVPSGGSAAWTEQKTLSVQRGLFHTLLGDQVIFGALAFNRPYWLSIQVASEPELSPRIPLASVGYSLNSAKADTARFAAKADTARYAISAPLQAAVDSARIASTVALPFSGTSSGSSDAFRITNSGTGDGLSVVNSNTSSNSEAVFITANGIGSGINVSLTNASNGARGINVTQAGVGPGVFATSAGGNALWGITSSISAAGVIGDNTFGEAIVGRNRGGNGVGAIVGRNDSSGYGVRGFNTKSGVGVLGQAGISGGTGIAGKFENVNAASGSDALQVVTNGTGRAAAFTSGPGVSSSTLAATQAENHKSVGEALWARTSSASNSTPVIKVLMHPSSPANFVEGVEWAGTGSITQRFHITSAGTFVAGSDFAEAFAVTGEVSSYEPGDVIVLAGAGPTSVEKSFKPYDTRVAGVYSTRPGVLGADKDGVTHFAENDIPVAIIGIVPTKVTGEGGPIQAGDLLTTSSTPGRAMKASPVSVNGIEIYPSGSILGKALEGFAGGEGTIKVLVTLR